MEKNTNMYGLTVTLAALGYTTQVLPVSTLEEASERWNEFRDMNGFGSRECTQQSGILKQNGKKIGHVSYNGRLWDLKNQLICE